MKKDVGIITVRRGNTLRFLAFDVRLAAGILFILLIIVSQLAVIPVWLEALISVPLIGLLGISHGAVDHLIARHAASKSRSGLSIISGYLLIIALYVALWLVLPVAAFLVFILSSIYYFGEAELHEMRLTSLSLVNAVLYMIWGSLILSTLFLAHFDEVVRITALLMDVSVLSSFGHILKWLALACYTVVTAVLVLIMSDKPEQRRIAVIRFAGLHLLLLLFNTTSLLLSFALFFGCWHALPVLKEEFVFLNSQSGMSAGNFIRSLVPFTLLSLAGIGLAAVFIQMTGLSGHVIVPVVIGLSVLTLPHALVMRRMYGV
jgi:Brp/Blh family beta-carotene 15,15'-monooxygenase